MVLMDVCTDGTQILMDAPLEGRHLLPSRILLVRRARARHAGSAVGVARRAGRLPATMDT